MKFKVSSLDFQKDNLSFLCKNQLCFFGNPKTALRLSGFIVGKKEWDDANIAAGDGWSSTRAPSIARE